MAPNKSLKRFSYRFILIFLLLPLIWILANTFGLLNYFEYLTLDWRFQQRGEITAPIKLIYVDLDSEALEFMGERPLPRSYFGQTADALFQYGGAKVVAIDTVFSGIAHSILVDESKIKLDNAILKKVIAERSGLILAASYTQREDLVTGNKDKRLIDFPYIHRGYTNPEENGLPEMPEISLIGGDGGNVALINTADHFSPGAIPHWVPVFAKTVGPTFYTMALEAVRIYHDLPKSGIEITPNKVLLKNETNEAQFTIPLTAQQLVEINWFTPWISEKNPRFSLKTILAAKAWLEQGSLEQQQQAQALFKNFQDALVLIGPTDPLLHDLAPTPFDNGEAPKVGVHGNLIKTITSGRYLERPHIAWNIVITFCLTLLVAAFAALPGKYSILFKILSTATLIIYVWTAFVSFNQWDWVLPLVMPIGSAATTAFGMIMIQLVETERQRSQIKGMFGSYVSPELVEHMVEQEANPELGGSEQEVSALFSDIAGFTNICEDLTPSQLITLINEYLSQMTEVIQEEQGTLDKYIGDAIVSMFGAPVKIEHHALAACRAACKMALKQEELRKKWISEGNKWTDKIKNMHTRIGINTGTVTVGNMGSEIRFNYTMLGDNVNLAARCESGAKSYGVYGMITENTYQLAKDQDVTFRYLDKIIVKGKTKPVSIYEIMGFAKHLTQDLQNCVHLYEEGFRLYTQKQWQKAIEKFQLSEKLERHQGPHINNPSKLFIQRCQLMQKEDPGENWDGVFVMKTK